MDLALTNYQIKDLFLQDNNFNVNDFVLDDFKRNLDATPNTKETYIKGVKVFLDTVKATIFNIEKLITET